MNRFIVVNWIPSKTQETNMLRLAMALRHLPETTTFTTTSKKMSSNVASNMQSISCYERLRLQNIERNQKFLKELGLEVTNVTAPKLITSRPKRKIDTEVPFGDVRRSSRVANLLAVTDYTEV